MVRTNQSPINRKITWIAVGIFSISGILPWFLVNFPIGDLKITILDLMIYFFDQESVSIDFYSKFIYGTLLSGWIFTLLMLIASAIFQRRILLLASSILAVIPPLIWTIIVPYLGIQMIFLNLSNQTINANQTLGAGEITAMIAGCVTVYAFLKIQLANKFQ